MEQAALVAQRSQAGHRTCRPALRSKILHRAGVISQLGPNLQRHALADEKRSKHSRAMINLETAADKPMFSSLLGGRHYLVLADGYYECRTVGHTNMPHLRARADRVRHGR